MMTGGGSRVMSASWTGVALLSSDGKVSTLTEGPTYLETDLFRRAMHGVQLLAGVAAGRVLAVQTG